ncbi:Heat shock protein 70, partial [Phytophthora megakarya]
GKKSALMIPRNTTIPTKKSRTFSASEDGQFTARIQIFEGDSDKMSDNNPLGQLIVVDISPKPRQSSHIEVTLDIDANCILRVSVVDKATGTKKQVEVDIDSLPPSEIERISKNLGVNEPHNESKVNLEKYANSVRSSAAKRIAELKREIDDMQAVEDEATETLRWAGSSRSTNSEEFDFKRRKLEDAAKQVSRNGSSTG